MIEAIPAFIDVDAFSSAVGMYTPEVILLLFIGLAIGLVAGAVPGMGAAVAMVLILPFTFALDPAGALICLIAIYHGAMYGGCIPAILMNVPGTAAAAASTFDGFPLSQKGEATRALSVSAISSAFGGFLASVILILLIPYFVPILLRFGAPEYFLIAFLGLLMITIVAEGSQIRGLVAGGFGMLLATVGVAPVPETRYTLGIMELANGIDYLAVLLGVFAVAEMIKFAAFEGGIAEDTDGGISRVSWSNIKEPFQHLRHFIKSPLIGMFVGSLPGAGGSVANFVSYTEAFRSTEDNESFGDGDIRGLIATEGSNNAEVAGALVPTLSFGIPGSGAAAVLLGGLIMHGMRPGPSLLRNQIDLIFAIYLAIMIGSVTILIFGLLFITKFSIITRVDTNILVPIIITLSAIGAIALNRNSIDLFTILLTGVLAFYMKRNNYSIIAFLLGIILGPIAEDNLVRSMQLGSPAIFVSSIESIILIVVIVLFLFGPYTIPSLKYLSRRVRGAVLNRLH